MRKKEEGLGESLRKEYRSMNGTVSFAYYAIGVSGSEIEVFREFLCFVDSTFVNFVYEVKCELQYGCWT